MNYAQIPQTIRIGTTYKWTETIADYPSADYSAAYVIAQSTNVTTITASANDDGISYDFEIGISTLSVLSAGDAIYCLYVEKGDPVTERYEIGRGTIKLLQNLKASQIADVRSHTKKVLDALESLIEGKTTADQLSISIAGVSVSRMSPEDIIRWYNFYKAKYEEEKMLERMEQGENVINSIRVKL